MGSFPFKNSLVWAWVPKPSINERDIHVKLHRYHACRLDRAMIPWNFRKHEAILFARIRHSLGRLLDIFQGVRSCARCSLTSRISFRREFAEQEIRKTSLATCSFFAWRLESQKDHQRLGDWLARNSQSWRLGAGPRTLQAKEKEIQEVKGAHSDRDPVGSVGVWLTR